MSRFLNLQHIVFRTKFSQPTIPMETRRTMLAYINNVSIDMGVKILRINAHLNHVHILANIRPDLAISEYVKKIKGTSSKAFKRHRDFPQFIGWSNKFGSFSKSETDRDGVIKYIMSQDEHHKLRTLNEELEDLFGREFFEDPRNRQEWLDAPYVPHNAVSVEQNESSDKSDAPT